MSVTDGARAFGIARKTLSAILNGRAGISPEMAIRLSLALGTTAESWLRSSCTMTSGTPSADGSAAGHQAGGRSGGGVTMHIHARKTVRGYRLGDVVSALQKTIRRGDARLAGYFAIEMFESNFAAYAWRRLLTISAEDCAGVITRKRCKPCRPAGND